MAHPEHASDNDHDLTIARIADEHASRQLLEEERLALAKQRDALLKETTAKKDELAKLDMEIEKWVASQDDVRKIFEEREHKAAKLVNDADDST